MKRTLRETLTPKIYIKTVILKKMLSYRQQRVQSQCGAVEQYKINAFIAITIVAKITFRY